MELTPVQIHRQGAPRDAILNDASLIEGIRTRVRQVIEEILRKEIEAVLANHCHGEDPSIETQLPAVLSEGPLTIDPSGRQATLSGEPLKLTPKEYDLLHLLMKKKTKVLTRQFLLESLWGLDYAGTDRTVDVHIRHLRDKLGPEAGAIETVERVGYVFVTHR